MKVNMGTLIYDFVNLKSNIVTITPIHLGHQADSPLASPPHIFDGPRTNTYHDDIVLYGREKVTYIYS